MSYHERARNLFWNFYDWYHTGSFNERMFDPIFREKFGARFPSVDRIFARVSLAFLNSNQFFDIARPTSHKIVYIGGIAQNEPKALAKVTPSVENQKVSPNPPPYRTKHPYRVSFCRVRHGERTAFSRAVLYQNDTEQCLFSRRAVLRSVIYVPGHGPVLPPPPSPFERKTARNESGSVRMAKSVPLCSS